MTADNVVSLVCGLTAAVVITYLLRLRKISRTYLTDYMRGLRFVSGAFQTVLGPGSYQPLGRREHIDVIDMRPTPILLERLSYRDAAGSPSIISIGAEVSVDDPYLAATSLKSRVKDSLPIVRSALRGTVSRSIVDGSSESRARVSEAVADAANEELRRVGMRISHVEITESFSRSASTQPVSNALN